MKIKLNNSETEMTEEEVSQYIEGVSQYNNHLLEDAGEIHSFILFLRDYIYTARIAGDACRGALIGKLHECLRSYAHCHQTIPEIRKTLATQLSTFKAKAELHHEFVKREYGPMSQIVK